MFIFSRRECKVPADSVLLEYLIVDSLPFADDYYSIVLPSLFWCREKKNLDLMKKKQSTNSNVYIVLNTYGLPRVFARFDAVSFFLTVWYISIYFCRIISLVSFVILFLNESQKFMTLKAKLLFWRTSIKMLLGNSRNRQQRQQSLDKLCFGVTFIVSIIAIFIRILSDLLLSSWCKKKQSQI